MVDYGFFKPHVDNCERSLIISGCVEYLVMFHYLQCRVSSVLYLVSTADTIDI